MISGLTAGYGIHINNGYYGTAPYVDTMKFDAGRLRMIGNILEVFTGNHWAPVTNGTTQVELSNNVVAVLQWAEHKMKEEAKIQALADQYPAVKDLKEKLDLVMTLVKDYNTETTS
jgi:hypothetical protein